MWIIESVSKTWNNNDLIDIAENHLDDESKKWIREELDILRSEFQTHANNDKIQFSESEQQFLRGEIQEVLERYNGEKINILQRNFLLIDTIRHRCNKEVHEAEIREKHRQEKPTKLLEKLKSNAEEWWYAVTETYTGESPYLVIFTHGPHKQEGAEFFEVSSSQKRRYDITNFLIEHNLSNVVLIEWMYASRWEVWDERWDLSKLKLDKEAENWVENLNLLFNYWAFLCLEAEKWRDMFTYWYEDRTLKERANTIHEMIKARPSILEMSLSFFEQDIEYASQNVSPLTIFLSWIKKIHPDFLNNISNTTRSLLEENAKKVFWGKETITRKEICENVQNYNNNIFSIFSQYVIEDRNECALAQVGQKHTDLWTNSIIVDFWSAHFDTQKFSDMSWRKVNSMQDYCKKNAISYVIIGQLD